MKAYLKSCHIIDWQHPDIELWSASATPNEVHREN